MSAIENACRRYALSRVCGRGARGRDCPVGTEWCLCRFIVLQMRHWVSSSRRRPLFSEFFLDKKEALHRFSLRHRLDCDGVRKFETKSLPAGIASWVLEH